MTRILGVVQVRMGSTRLPGKVLRRLGDRTVLGRVVRAARESDALDDLVVATTEEPGDDAVVEECARLDVAVHRGPGDDVLTRFLGAVAARPADALMRFTADCPLLDPEIVAMTGRVFRAVPDVDYLSTAIVRCLPRGLDVEVVRTEVLRRVGEVATDFHRTHVTSYVWSHPHVFRVLGLTLAPDRSDLRLTLDTAADWDLLEAVVTEFGDATPTFAKLVEWLDAHPAVRALNAGVVQKALECG